MVGARVEYASRVCVAAGTGAEVLPEEMGVGRDGVRDLRMEQGSFLARILDELLRVYNTPTPSPPFSHSSFLDLSHPVCLSPL